MTGVQTCALPILKAGAWGIHVPYPITWELEMAKPMTDHERYFEANNLSHEVEIIKSISDY